jgi:large subunit ribosomal protein L25
MQRTELHVKKRDTRHNARFMRREGRLPGVVYGAGGANVLVEVAAVEFARQGLGSSGAHLIRFASDDASLDGGVALVRELQIHPIERSLMHVDFLRVDLTKPVQTEVALSYVGKAKGIVDGGMVQPLRRVLEVRALPDKLPEVIEVDVNDLGIHDVIHVADLKLPEGVEAVYSENFTIVTVVPPVVEAAPVEEAAAVTGVEGAPAAEGAAAATEGKAEEKEEKDDKKEDKKDKKDKKEKKG